MLAAMQAKTLREAGFTNADIIETAKRGLVEELAPLKSSKIWGCAFTDC